MWNLAIVLISGCSTDERMLSLSDRGPTGIDGSVRPSGAASLGNYMEVSLTPDAYGWVNGSSNPLGIQGDWYRYSDLGTCKAAGYPASACTTVMLRGAGFPNVGGVMCTAATGTQTPLVNGPSDLAIWGAAVGLDFADSIAGGPRGIFDARAHNVLGVSFDIDVIPGDLRVTFPARPQETDPRGADYWGALATFPSSPVTVGTNTVLFREVVSPELVPQPIDTTQLEAIQFLVPAAASWNRPSYCVSNLKMLLVP